MRTGDTASFKFIINLLSTISEAMSNKYLALKLIVKLSELYFAGIVSLPSPEDELFTKSCIFSFSRVTFTPSFLSIETVITLSIQLIKSSTLTSKILLLLLGTTFSYSGNFPSITLEMILEFPILNWILFSPVNNSTFSLLF